MYNLVWTSDLHFDLTTEGLDRNPEIRKVLSRVVKYANKVKADALVLGGDIFDSNKTNEETLDMVYSELEGTRDKTEIIFIDGNHEVKYGEHKSVLSFFENRKNLNAKVFHDITVKKLKAKDKKSYIVFLPYIARSNIPEEYKKNPQKYYDDRCESIIKKLCVLKHEVVFLSHLNVPGVHPGVEGTFLKRCDFEIPKCLTRLLLDKPDLRVYNGHHHKHEHVNGVWNVGSPVYSDFAEVKSKKHFLHLSIPTKPKEVFTHKFIPSKCNKMIALELNLEDLDNYKSFVKDVKKTLKKKKSEKAIVKIKVDLMPKAHGFNKQAFYDDIEPLCKFLRSVETRMIRNPVKRNKKQRVGLSPRESVDIWIDKQKPRSKKSIKKYAYGLIDEI